MTSKETKDEASMNDMLPITSLLKVLGHNAISTTEEESSYSSVLGEQPDNRGVLKVSHRLNSWFDKSLGIGGNLMDFAQVYWPELSPEEIERKLHDIQMNISSAQPPDERPRRKRKAFKIPHYQIERTHPIGHNIEITDFLKKSGLWELADLNIKEIYYFVIDQKGRRKNFCAAGWQNENGGWEIRAQHFEGCIGTKGMTFLSRSESALAIFPEYVDYLKRRSDNYLHYASVLILNYPVFFSASMKRARHFKRVLFYVDEMRNGYRSATEAFMDKLPNKEVIPI
ncbi:hypothetical protein [Sphingobacterium faecium]|uniref:hypothetical protein n=1 Tax=Sphingobacterium faecium TaxID=34087 RepID=UPI0032097DCA